MAQAEHLPLTIPFAVRVIKSLTWCWVGSMFSPARGSPGTFPAHLPVKTITATVAEPSACRLLRLIRAHAPTILPLPETLLFRGGRLHASPTPTIPRFTP